MYKRQVSFCARDINGGELGFGVVVLSSIFYGHSVVGEGVYLE